MAIDLQPGTPFHGEFSSADASALSEPNSRFALYGPSPSGGPVAITLGANDVVVVDDVIISNAAAITITVYDGADNAVGSGERICKAITPINSAIYQDPTIPHFCQAGTYPKVKASGAGQVDVTIRGTIFRRGS